MTESPNSVEEILAQADKTLVLVVDNDKLSRQLLRKMMKHLGYNVEEASDGVEALQVYEATAPDVVLLDAKMPNMDGFEVCRRLKARYGADAAPIIMITGLDDTESITKAIELGAFDYISKPFNSTILQNRVRRLVHSRKTQRDMLQRNRLLETVNLVTKSINTSKNSISILESITFVSGHNMEVDLLFVRRFDDLMQSVSIVGAYYIQGITPLDNFPQVGAVERLSDTFPYLLHWFEQAAGYKILRTDTGDLSPEAQAYYDRFNVASILLVPMTTNGELLGYFEYWHLNPDRYFNSDGVRLALSIASQTAVSLRSQMLREEAARYAAELELRNRELDAYNYTIAHDLKNPINMMINYADITLISNRETLDEDSQSYLARVVESGKDMALMIDDLLTLAQLRDSMVDTISEINMTAMAHEAVSRYGNLIEERGITVDIEDMPAALGHGQWMKEIFANLVSNAIKYIGEDNAAPRIILRGYQLETAFNRYEVEDNGIGIPKNEQDKLFEMFARANDALAVDGFGLGLSIVLRMVNNMDGQVGVESEPKVGSLFWFDLPAINPA